MLHATRSERAAISQAYQVDPTHKVSYKPVNLHSSSGTFQHFLLEQGFLNKALLYSPLVQEYTRFTSGPSAQAGPFLLPRLLAALRR
jgi:hypothetical protein